jgi:diacylglycerol kinase family enzyme
VTVVGTPRRDRPDELASALDGVDVVAVLSGDGTVNQVANVLADLHSDATLVPLPAGATNVAARSIGLPRDLGAANQAALDALDAGKTSRIGWGRLDGRGFLCNAGIGLDALVVQRVETDLARKRRWGHLWFAAAAVRTVGEARTTRLRCEGCGADPAIEACWAVALARTPYSYAGPLPIDLVGRDVTDRSGLPGGAAGAAGLWLVHVPPAPIPRLALLAGRALLRRSGIAGHAGVTARQVTGPVTCRSLVPVPAQVDGEPLPAATSFTLDWQPDALRVIGPL